MILRTAITLVSLLAAVVARAAVLELPWPAKPLAERNITGTSHFLATGPFIDGPMEGVVAEGDLHRQSWRVAGEITTVQLLAPLRQQLTDAGFEILFECETRACGGFDFRFQIDVLPEPEMHVNLGDYRYLSAKGPADGNGEDYISMILSRSANAGFVHITRVTAGGNTASAAASGMPEPSAMVTGDVREMVERLELAGYVYLDDLTFETGSSRLGDETFASLTALASYLKTRPDRTVVLVGHTDAVGDLDSNIELSRLRAAAVMERLVIRHEVPPGQVISDGVGFLAPRAGNLTEEGRARNRRVEAVLNATE
ncbi:MAG: OmpA family protein [Rhodobacter sp.]|nr:OmpA family protein [Rhodobacter sp.]MCY4168144.1 OmpA family protein [Rhodobacter sp.]